MPKQACCRGHYIYTTMLFFVPAKSDLAELVNLTKFHLSSASCLMKQPIVNHRCHCITHICCWEVAPLESNSFPQLNRFKPFQKLICFNNITWNHRSRVMEPLVNTASVLEYNVHTHLDIQIL